MATVVIAGSSRRARSRDKAARRGGRSPGRRVRGGAQAGQAAGGQHTVRCGGHQPLAGRHPGRSPPPQGSQDAHFGAHRVQRRLRPALIHDKPGQAQSRRSRSAGRCGGPKASTAVQIVVIDTKLRIPRSPIYPPRCPQPPGAGQSGRGKPARQEVWSTRVPIGRVRRSWSGRFGDRAGERPGRSHWSAPRSAPFIGGHAARPFHPASPRREPEPRRDSGVGP